MQNYKDIYKKSKNNQKLIEEIDTSITKLKAKKQLLKDKLNHGKEEGQFIGRGRDLKQLG